MTVQILPGNRVDLLQNGAEYFPALAAAIESARYEVYLETYIFENDRTGRAIADTLCRAALRGVAVRILVDGFGSRHFPETLMDKLSASGVEVLLYRPDITRFNLGRQRLRRLHRKVSIVDARLAFVGGINIIDDMHTPGQTPPRMDFAVRIEGPLIAPIHESAKRLWELVTWANFRRRFRVRAQPRLQAYTAGGVQAAFVVRDNLGHRRDIEDMYLEAIAHARREIVLANAYFLPGRRFRRALVQAARRGVEVVILVQGRVEYALFHYASKALHGSLLAGGVRIFEYHKSFLHAKVAVVDHHWATVGSSNIDPFSLLLAREANVAIRDDDFARRLRASLHCALSAGAHEIKRHDWEHRPLIERFVRWMAFGLVRLMIGLAGYGSKH